MLTLFGVPWRLTPKSRLFIPTRLGPGVLAALVLLQGEPVAMRVAFGVIYSLLLILTQILHTIGHTLSAHYVGAPITANLILDTKILTHYANDPNTLPSRVHLGRAIGGPLMNIIVGISTLATWWLAGSHILLFLAAANLILGCITLLPLPGIDGEVIWREVRRSTAD